MRDGGTVRRDADCGRVASARVGVALSCAAAAVAAGVARHTHAHCAAREPPRDRSVRRDGQRMGGGGTTSSRGSGVG